MADLPGTVSQDEDEEASEPLQDQTHDASDPASVQRQLQKASFREEAKRDLERQLLYSATGRMWLWDHLMLDCHFEQDTIACSPAGMPDERGTWLQLGQASVGRRLRDRLMRADLMMYGKMLEEHHPDFVKPKPKKQKVKDG